MSQQVEPSTDGVVATITLNRPKAGNRLTIAMAAAMALAEEIQRHARKTATADSFGKYYTAFSKTDFSSLAKNMKTPMLVLIGAKDGRVSEEFVRATFPPLYPHAELEVLPDAGHSPMIENPGRLMSRIQDYLAGRASA